MDANWSRNRVTVYPRVCGGTLRAAAAGSGIKGLSPRVRGNPARATGRRGWLGSIPACAGEPAGYFSSTVRCGVYPRVCGGTQ